MAARLTAILTGFFCAIATFSSGAIADDGRMLRLGEIKRNSTALDGQVVKTTGFLIMRDTDMNIVSSTVQNRKQICIGVLVTETEFSKLNNYDHKWVTLVGTLHRNRCTGQEYCPYSCSSTVFTDVSVKSLNLN